MKVPAPCAPGPGAYHADAETSLSSGLEKRVTSRAGAFGCAGPRFKERSRRAALQDAEAPSPGPGSYEAGRVAAGARGAEGVCAPLAHPPWRRQCDALPGAGVVLGPSGSEREPASVTWEPLEV